MTERNKPGSLDETLAQPPPDPSAPTLGDPSGAASASPTLPRGTDLGRYIVLDCLGRGGMAVVYAAYDRELDRKLAIKLLRHGTGATDTQGRTRLVREAQALARFQHANVVAVYDIGTFEDQVFIAMEHVDGVTLRTWLEARERGWREVRDVFVAAGNALKAAHDAGMVHRDFKPDNVMIGADGRVRVLDFGLARAVFESKHATVEESAPDVLRPSSEQGGALGALETPLTRAGALMGTPAYMSPEQWRRQVVDHRSDQFSFCVALWEGLFGPTPLRGASLPVIEQEVLRGDLWQTTPSHRAVPEWLKAVVLRGLRPDPAARYPHMQELLSALVNDPEVARRQRRRVVSGVVGAIALLAIAGFGVLRGAKYASQCAGVDGRLAGVWDAPRKAALRAAFHATGRANAGDIAERVEHALDAQLASWVSEARQSCEATRTRGEQSERLFDLRNACFNRRLGEVKSLVDTLAARADVGVLDHAVEAAARLTPVEVCADTRALEAVIPPPDDPSVRHKVDDVAAQVAQAQAFFAAGKLGPALANAKRAASDASSIDYAPIQAEALYERGELEESHGDYQASLATQREAMTKAALGRDDTLIGWIWLATFAVLTKGESRFADALLLVPYADAAIVRAGDASGQRAGLEQYIAGILGSQGKYTDAIEHYRRALAIAMKRDQHESTLKHDLHLATILRNMGWTLRLMGNEKEALDDNEKALALFVGSLGAEHPMIANVHVGISDCLIALGRLSEAEGHVETAITILDHTVGPDHPEMARALFSLSSVQHVRGKHAEELASDEHALAIMEAAHGATQDDVADAAMTAASALLEARRYDEAERQLRRALPIYEKIYGAKDQNVANVLVGLVASSLAQHRIAEALAEAERALTIVQSAQMAPGQAGDVYLALAKTRWATGSHAAALSAAAQAAAAYQEAGKDFTSNREELATWQSTHH